MLPQTHIILGAIFSLTVWLIFPNLNFSSVFLIFLSSFLVDLDHYFNAVIKTKKINLKDAFFYYKILTLLEQSDISRGIKRRGEFHIFHTIEFHLLVALIGVFFQPFFFIFIGMIFHSLLDFFSLIKEKRLHRREYFFANWIRVQFKN